jgi:small-conductance mechanosensitive channel
MTAWAQTAETEPPQVQVDPVEVVASPAPLPTSVPADQPSEASTIDFDDPAILAAIEARDDAERAFAAAVREQMEAAEQAGPQDETAPKKPSIIPSNAEDVKALLGKIGDKILGWLTSIKFLAQVGAIALAYILSPLISKKLLKKVFLFRDKPADDVKIKIVRDYIYQIGSLLRPIMLVVLLILFGAILEAVPAAGDTWLVKIAQSLSLVYVLYKAIKEFIGNDLIQKLAIWTAIPLALIMLLGYYDDLIDALNGVVLMKMGDTPISLMTVIMLLIFGGLFFKLGNIANSKGQSAIRSQEGLDLATQEVVGKMFQIFLFTIVFIMVMGAAKVPLSGLVVIFSALSLGVGLGLQPIAANFVSGIIILFDRSVKAGDYVVLPDGQEGFVEAINMRNTVVETTDGKDIMVPNTKFTEEAYENWTHKDPRQRYEVHFCVAYDTNLDALEDMLIPEVLKHRQVLREPEMPDLEFRSFGENGVNMAIEFWCDGIDDGPNKFTSDVNFIVWRTLRDNKIEIPFPQRVVHTK